MKSIFLTFFSGLLLIFCFPKFDLGFFAWFAFVPLLIAIKDKGLKSAFALSLITGMIFYSGVFYWFKLVNGVNWFEHIFLCLYFSSYFGLFGLGLNFFSKKSKLPHIVTAPALWIALEYTRSHAGIAHPMMLMGHSQYLNLPIIQISSFLGVYGISFLIVMINVAICGVIVDRSRAFRPTIAAIIILGISLVYGFSAVKKESGSDSIRITVIQANIPKIVEWKPAVLKRNLKKYVWLTKESLHNNPAALVVWPENTLLRSIKRDPYSSQLISILAKETKSNILFGNSHRPKSGHSRVNKGKRFNSAILISKEGKLEGQYNKIRLVPFAEYIPYKDSFPWLSRFASKTSNFISGTEYTIFNLDKTKFGTLICWENIYPEHFRQFVKKGANLMINITNEVLLGKTAAPYQLVAISVFRAVENRISVVRCANTGISCFINPYGKIVGRVHDQDNKATFVEGYLTQDVPLAHEKTFYTKYGDIFLYMNFLMTLFILSFSFLRRK